MIQCALLMLVAVSLLHLLTLTYAWIVCTLFHLHLLIQDSQSARLEQDWMLRMPIAGIRDANSLTHNTTPIR